MAAETSACSWAPLRSAGWAVACGLITSGALLGMHALEIRGRPELPPILPDHPTRVDAYGDPMPLGAVARLGSRRFRVGAGGVGLEILPDGKRFVAGLPDQRIGVFDVRTGVRSRTLDGHLQWTREQTTAWSLRQYVEPHVPCPMADWTRPFLAGLLFDPEREVVWSWDLDRARRGEFVVSRIRDGNSKTTLVATDPDVLVGSRTPTRHIGFWTDEAVTHRRQRVTFQAAVLRAGRRPAIGHTQTEIPVLSRPWRICPSPRGDVWVQSGYELGETTSWAAIRNFDPAPLPETMSHGEVVVLDVVSAATGEPKFEIRVARRFPQVAWQPDGRFWTFAPEGAQLHDPDGSVVISAEPVIRPTRSPDIAILPRRRCLLIGREAMQIPDWIELDWSEPAELRAAFATLADPNDGDPLHVDAVLTEDRLVVAIRFRSGIVRTLRFDREGPAAGPEIRGHLASIDSMAWDAASRTLVSVDARGSEQVWHLRDIAGPCELVLEEGRPSPIPWASRDGFLESGISVNLAVDRHAPTDILTISGPSPRSGSSPWMTGVFVLPPNDDAWRSRLNDLTVTRTVDGGRLPGWESSIVLETYPVNARRADGHQLRYVPPFFGEQWPTKVVVGPHRRWLVLHAAWMRARLIDLTDGKVRFVFPPDEGRISAALWHPSGRFVVTGGVDGSILVWDVDEMIEHGR